MNDHEIVKLAMRIAGLREKTPLTAQLLEQTLYKAITERLPESKIRYVLELTEPQVYQ